MINGYKRWIGNGTWADVTVVWARNNQDGQVGAERLAVVAAGISRRVCLTSPPFRLRCRTARLAVYMYVCLIFLSLTCLRLMYVLWAVRM